MQGARSAGRVVACSALAVALSVLGHSRLGEALGPSPRASAPADLFTASDTRGRVRDGPLIGTGYERIEKLADGGLRLFRARSYTEVIDTDSKRRVRLPERWESRQSFELSRELRLRREEVRLYFHRSIDRALGYDASKHGFAWLFEWDRMLVIANTGGSELNLATSLSGRSVDHTHYDYPRAAVPIEIAALSVSVRVAAQRERFDFDVLLPGGDVHGVEAVVHRTHELRPFSTGYQLPLAALRRFGELAVVDMRLASPFKRLLFPHHFYFAYRSDDPAVLVAAWGGDPDQPLLAIREN